MSVNGVNDTFGNLGLAVRQTEKRTELGQDAFLKLMTTQMQHQDPFKPMDNGAFLGQIAQFSTVSGIQSMNDSLSGLSSALTSNQSLQAASLVGHGVLVPGNRAYLFSEGGLSGSASLPTSGTLSVTVSDASGQVVRRLDLGTQPAGNADFSWDGLDESGERLAQGSYTIKATLDAGGAQQALETSTVGLVSSVSLSSSGLSLNLVGMDPVALAKVREII